MNIKNIFYFLGSSVILLAMLILGAPILKPLVFALLLTIMLSPIQNLFDRFITFRLLSIFFTLITVLIPLGLIISIFVMQSRAIFSSTDYMVGALTDGMQEIINVINQYTPFTMNDINENWASMSEPLIDFLSSGLSSTVNTVALIFLCLIFMVFFMWYRQPLVEFLVLQFPDHKKEQVWRTLRKTKKMLVSYMAGIGTVMVIMSVINSLGLYLIGIDHAVFFGVLAALLAIVPYIGTTLGGFLPFLYALATGNWVQAIAVAIFYFSIQQVEGNFITPKIVGDSVSINPFVAILGIAIGAIIWGIAGVVLAFPIIGLMRIVFYEIYALRPLALIIGNQIISDKMNMSDYDEEKYRLSSLFSKNK